MDGITMIRERRSVRKYENRAVSRKLITEIIDTAKFAPSWSNFQIARYNIIDSKEKLREIAEKGLCNFALNLKTLDTAQGVVVLSYIKGQSGKNDPEDLCYASEKRGSWEIFDAGVATQTFCLAAHEKGLGTCILGIFDSENISEIINLPDNEAVGAVITYGYPFYEMYPTPRHDTDTIVRFID